MVCLRDSLAGSNVNVIEVPPPYVRTDLDAANRMGGNPMELDEYTQQTLKILEKPGKEIKEAAVGFAAVVAGKWREAFDPVLKMRHSRG